MYNILIDICHPAHVHLFKGLIVQLKNRGHSVHVTVKNIPNAITLLKENKIDFIYLGDKGNSFFSKAYWQVAYNYKIRKLFKTHNIHLAIGSSISIAQAAFLTKTKAFIFDEDDNAVEPLFVLFGHMFADKVLSPDVLKHDKGSKKYVLYPSYHELAYLHPDVFVPDDSFYLKLDLKKGDPYFILRFNSFNAHHDSGHSGIPYTTQKKLIHFLESRGRVFISTEKALPAEYLKYKIDLKSNEIHSLLSFATMLISDSQTMTKEAAVLGVPAIRCNSFKNLLSVLNELEYKYQLIKSFDRTEHDQIIPQIERWLLMPTINQIWLENSRKLLKDKTNPNHFFINFLENRQ